MYYNILSLLLLTTTNITLIYAAKHDIKHQEINLKTLLIILTIGITYTITTENTINNLLTIQTTITIIYIIPTIMGMGWGDMYLLWTIGFYIPNTDQLKIFLAAFLIAATILTTYYITKKKTKEQKLKNYYFPLIPAITTAFIILTITQILSSLF